MMLKAPISAELDLVLERELEVPTGLVWRALTEPELLKQWFCPKPWGLAECRLDLRPGGEFYSVMQSPEGDKFPGTSCFLEVVPEQRLTWTSTLHRDYRPAPALSDDSKDCHAIAMTCIVTIEPTDKGTKYVAHVMHNSPEQQKAHEDMGFYEGWGTTVTQMEELLKGM